MNTQQKKYDLIVYIGRFQPFHIGHQETLKKADYLADNVLVLIGSANGPRTTKNPWTYDERAEAIKANGRILNLHVEDINDISYNDNAWIEQVGAKVNAIKQKITLNKFNTSNISVTDAETIDLNVAFIGHDKDKSSYYLNYFKHYDFIEMQAYPAKDDQIDSTAIRQLMFSNQASFTDNVIPGQAYGNQVRKFIKTDAFYRLQREWDSEQNEKRKWEVAPYNVNFNTVDAVVEQSGHVLLIQRGQMPGKGLWAMPGGFLETTEVVLDGVIRELREETMLKVPEKVLRGSIRAEDYFDDPNRSLRGRTITFTYLFKLDDAADLPKVKGNDDAADARWVPLAEFEQMQSVMFEDHYSIIKNMLGRG